MHILAFTVVVAACSQLVSTRSLPLIDSQYQVHQRRDVLPHTSLQRRRLERHETIPLKIYLTQQNLELGADRLLEISDPKSSKYGQHWDAVEVASFFQPHASSVHDVKTWLGESGIADDRIVYSESKGMLSLHASADEAEQLLGTTFHQFHNSDTGVKAIGCDEYSLPGYIHAYVDFITPTLSLPAPGKRTRHSVSKKAMPERRATAPNAATSNPGLADCSFSASPACIKALYRIPDFVEAPQPGNSMGIYQGSVPVEAYVQSDLDKFYALYAPNIPAGTHPINASIDGGLVATTNDADEGNEAMLDYEVALPIVYPQNVTAFVTGANEASVPTTGNPTARNTGLELFLDAIDRFFCYENQANENKTLACGKYRMTNVLSVSYAGVEYKDPPEYEERVCNEFLKLGLQGHTVVIASGDGGVGLPESDACGGVNGTVFTPNDFAACPWVLTVGGTQLNAATANATNPGVEVGWNGPIHNFVTGGGFSNRYPTPAYQYLNVQEYLANANLSFPSYSRFYRTTNATLLGQGTDGVFNRIGRAYPDVAALAFNIATLSDGIGSSEDGTSAATPIWGAIITRINEERLRAGKRTVGFINPVLYWHPEVFNDILNGTNGNCLEVGFHASKGWDPVTGLGTPIYTKLLELFMSFP